ncbi:hypothetical protein, partial [Teichococcus deserti]|uniref:hypothetical protein n=1 Tax=Teichococcus deserti TaxID=1817963 RepID=UPI0013F5B567
PVTIQPPVVTPPADPVLDLHSRLNADSSAARGRYPEPTNALIRQVEHWSWAVLAANGRKNGPVPASEETDPTAAALAIYNRIVDHAALDPQAAAMIAGWVQAIETVLDGQLPDRETPDPVTPPASGEVEALKAKVAALVKERDAARAERDALRKWLAAAPA